MKTVWEKYEGTELKKLMNFSEDYKKFLDNAKTEREAVNETIRLAKKAGFKEFRNVKSVKAGDKYFFNNQIDLKVFFFEFI